MAQRSGNSKGKKTGSKSSAGKKKAPAKKPAPQQQSGPTAADLWDMFRGSKAFIPVVTVVSILLLIGLDLLFSLNNYELFFKILGVELIIAFAFWIINLIVSLGRDSKKNSDPDGV